MHYLKYSQAFSAELFPISHIDCFFKCTIAVCESNAYEWMEEWRLCLPSMHTQYIHSNYLFTISLQPLSHRFKSLQCFGRLEKFNVWTAVFFRSQRSHCFSGFEHALFIRLMHNFLAVIYFSFLRNTSYTMPIYRQETLIFFPQTE